MKVALDSALKLDHATPFLRELGWLKLKQKYMLEIGIMMYVVTKMSSPYAIYHIPLVSEISAATTRQQHQLYVPRSHTCTGARSTLVAGPTLWNSIPQHIRNANTLRSFKKLLFRHLFSQQFTD